MPEHETFIWHELITDDQETAGAFYSGLFDWERHEADAGPLGTYTIFRRDGRDVAGMMRPTAPDYAGSPPPRWLNYIAVDDVEATAARAVELGGRVMVAPHAIEGVGRLCLLIDPVGALVHLMEPETTPPG